MLEMMKNFLAGMSVTEKAFAPRGMAQMLLAMATGMDRLRAEINELQRGKQ